MGRSSHRVALYFQQLIQSHNRGTAEILDLYTYQFPIFDERLKFQKNPAPATVEFADKIRKADAVILVTPEYNGSYTAAVKNVVDLLNDEWQNKPIVISTVSAGDFAGSQAVVALQFILWKLKARVVSQSFQVARVQASFDETGKPSDGAGTDKRALAVLDALLKP